MVDGCTGKTSARRRGWVKMDRISDTMIYLFWFVAKRIKW